MASEILLSAPGLSSLSTPGSQLSAPSHLSLICGHRKHGSCPGRRLVCRVQAMSGFQTDFAGQGRAGVCKTSKSEQDRTGHAGPQAAGHPQPVSLTWAGHDNTAVF